MTIEIDDAGTGDLVGDAFIGFLRKETGELIFKTLLVDLFKGENWRDKKPFSDLTLKYSKSRGIDTTYRNMLITRTKGIVDHIKNLKAGQVEKILFEEDAYIPEEEIQEEKTSEIIEKGKLVPQKKETKGIRPSEPVEEKEVKIGEESNFKSIPEGFKEIQTSTDFEIITPHDEGYVKKRLSQKTNQSQEQKSLPEHERLNFEQPEDSENLICFACGYDKNPKNAKTCKSCGTKLN